MKNEFQHHQEKLDEFHQLKQLAARTEDGNLLSNDIDIMLNEDTEKFDSNTLDGKGKQLKKDYDRLHR